MRNSVFLIWTLLLIGIIDLHAQEKDSHEFLVEADPLPFIMGGLGGHFGWSPKKSEHFRACWDFILWPANSHLWNLTSLFFRPVALLRSSKITS